MTHRSFIAIILAAALAITGMTTAPARAGNDDVAKWIAGAVALGLIGAAIAEEKKRDRRRDQAVARQHNKGHAHGKQKQRVHGHIDSTRKHVAKQDRRRFLPQSCQVRVRGHQGTVSGFGRRCLLNNYAHYNSLPHQCARRAQGNHGRVIYTGGCLRSHGYRMAAY
jgi:hypothetical protein